MQLIQFPVERILFNGKYLTEKDKQFTHLLALAQNKHAVHKTNKNGSISVSFKKKPTRLTLYPAGVA